MECKCVCNQRCTPVHLFFYEKKSQTSVRLLNSQKKSIFYWSKSREKQVLWILFSRRHAALSEVLCVHGSGSSAVHFLVPQSICSLASLVTYVCVLGAGVEVGMWVEPPCLPTHYDVVTSHHFLGSGPKGVDDLYFHTYGEFSPSPSSPSFPLPLRSHS